MGCRVAWVRGWAGLLGGTLIAGFAWAAEPVAIVEAVSGGSADVTALDYLAPGRVITLAASQKLVLDYLRSCARETISGGKVTVGESESRVAGGSVRRERVDCDGNRPRSDVGATRTNDVNVVAPPRPRGQPQEHGIARTLYGATPLIDMGGPGRLAIDRVDAAGAPLALDLKAAQLERGRFYDLAKAGKRLAPGGVYRASSRGRSVIFWIDPLARPCPTPLAGRLLQLAAPR